VALVGNIAAPAISGTTNTLEPLTRIIVAEVIKAGGKPLSWTCLNNLVLNNTA
tara:strand:+ start:1343 stop:1501 length:159 start_codon:yes stop_codon:yes gene_type:complete